MYFLKAMHATPDTAWTHLHNPCKVTKISPNCQIFLTKKCVSREFLYNISICIRLLLSNQHYHRALIDGTSHKANISSGFQLALSSSAITTESVCDSMLIGGRLNAYYITGCIFWQCNYSVFTPQLLSLYIAITESLYCNY